MRLKNYEAYMGKRTCERSKNNKQSQQQHVPHFASGKQQDEETREKDKDLGCARWSYSNKCTNPSLTYATASPKH